MNDSSICLKPINDLLTDADGEPRRFWIPAYQRGYRWKPLQVTQLLDDIWEFIQTSEGGKREAFYCLQPLVIKQLDDGRCEVVDGQQRLTTIYILLTYLKEIASMLGKHRFSITFETRGEANEPFLKAIDLSRAEENVDFFHICEAYLAIEEWFSSRDAMHKLKLLQHLLNDNEAGKNVQVIWFQLSDTDNPIDAFTRLNVGKIPLTNDELIRALFLRRGANPNAESESLQLRIAYEWDQLEKSLQGDPFWYFLSNEKGPQQNRIGFLFRLVAEASGLPKGMSHDPLDIFYTYNEKLKGGKTSPKAEWLKIKQAFMQLDEWFEDRILYHIVGFLIHQGMGIGTLRKLAEATKKGKFEETLRQKIFERTINVGALSDMEPAEVTEKIREQLDDLEYGKNSGMIRSLLLLFNIATLLENLKSNIRFQFDSFKQEEWDIEHIRSVTDDQPKRHNEKIEWMKHTLACLQAQETESDLAKRIEEFVELPLGEEADQIFEPLYGEILVYFKETEGEESDHTIANLTLLDRGTNRSYKNAVYAVKRKRLLELDQAGIFVPLCTRNVFLKCYSPQAENVLFWSKSDREAYREAMVVTLAKFFKPREGTNV